MRSSLSWPRNPRRWEPPPKLVIPEGPPAAAAVVVEAEEEKGGTDVVEDAVSEGGALPRKGRDAPPSLFPCGGGLGGAGICEEETLGGEPKVEGGAAGLGYSTPILVCFRSNVSPLPRSRLRNTKGSEI